MLQSSSSEKKLVKPLKNCFFGPNLHRKEVIMGHAQDGNFFFFGTNNKSRSSAFRKFLFYQNIICFDWVMNLFLSWVMFSVKKKVSFLSSIKKQLNGAMCVSFSLFLNFYIKDLLDHFLFEIKSLNCFILNFFNTFYCLVLILSPNLNSISENWIKNCKINSS